MSRIALPKASHDPKPGASATVDPSRSAKDHRETVESIVVAVILALLVRGFLVEAFVIPTGSMSPTLMGRHKEITCPQCGYVYQVNASEEAGGPPERVKYGTCGNCRFVARVDDEPSFKGDRILVMKFPYSMPWLPGGGGPRRWDVVVFHYPEKPEEQNYIKRLVGLPGEDLRVHAGDILARPHADPDAPFLLQTKPLNHLRAMLTPVFDDADRAEALKSDPQWRRWAPDADKAWAEGPDGTYTASTAEMPGAGWAQLRYRHRVPDPEQWEALLAKGKLPTPPRSTLITDFNPYNAGMNSLGREDGLDPHWVGDLSVEFALDVTSDAGKLRIELVRGGVPYRCEIDAATGVAALFKGGQPLGKPAQTAIKGPGRHDVAFANVDGRLTLWVDGATPFGDGVIHDDGQGPRPNPTAADLEPAGVASRGLGARVSGLVLKRDIYYTLSPSSGDYGHVGDKFGQDSGGVRHAVAVFDLLADPSRFAGLGHLKSRDFEIAPHRYMMMGDNSPRSKDGRAWGTEDWDWDPSQRASNEVPEALLIGKAFVVYWPHGVPFWPNLAINRDFRVPFLPHFRRMKWIR